MLSYYKREGALVEGSLTNLKQSALQFGALPQKERRGPRLNDSALRAGASSTTTNQGYLQVDARESAMQGAWSLHILSLFRSMNL